MTLVQQPLRKRRGLKKERLGQMKERKKNAGLSHRPRLGATEMKRKKKDWALPK